MRRYLVRMPGGDRMEFVAKSKNNALRRARQQAKRDAQEAPSSDVRILCSEPVR